MQDFENYINQFGTIDKEAIEDLKNCFYPKNLLKNEFFTQEGDYSKKVGFLKEGIIRAYFRDLNGKEFSKQFFVGPAIIGAYTSLITSQPSKISQQALTKCTILVANYNRIIELYDKHRSLEQMGRKLAEFYYVEKEQKLIEQAVLDAEKRYQLLKERFPTYENRIPQYYIASYLGISPTQLSRIRKKLATISLHM